MYIEGLSFIVLPLGWFEHINFACLGISLLEEKKFEQQELVFRGWYAKVLAEEAIKAYEDEHSEWSRTATEFTLLTIEIPRY